MKAFLVSVLFLVFFLTKRVASGLGEENLEKSSSQRPAADRRSFSSSAGSGGRGSVRSNIDSSSLHGDPVAAAVAGSSSSSSSSSSGNTDWTESKVLRSTPTRIDFG